MQAGWNQPQGQQNRPNNPYVPLQQNQQSPGFGAGQRQPQQLAVNFDFNHISEMPTKYPRV